MLMRTLQSLLITCLLAGTVSAASDPFVGKWKLDVSKSRLTGRRIAVQTLGGNKYSLTFPGSATYTLLANGTPKRVGLGYAMSLTAEDGHVWKFAVNQNGHRVSTITWTLSVDERTILAEAIRIRPDGATVNTRETFKRSAGSTGFAGVWETTSVAGESEFAPEEQVIRPYDHGGLTFDFPAWGYVISVKFDGKDYPETGPDVPPGATSSARRLSERAINQTEKFKGRVTETLQLRVSNDGKTLTATDHYVGESMPQVYVYDRE